MLAAVSMCKDEADIIEQTIGRLQTFCDFIIVADNGSTDGTRDILGDLGVIVRDDPEVGYYQSVKMTALAQDAAKMGAEWVIPFDADEIWLPQREDVVKTLHDAPPECLTSSALLFDHVATGADHPGPPLRSLRWRRATPAPLRKVAVRVRDGMTIHQGNHSALYKGVPNPLDVPGLFVIRHFPLRTPEQFIRKARNGAAAYAASNLPEHAGAHWRGWGKLTDEQLVEVFRKWYWRDDPAQPIEIEGERQPALVEDPCPSL